MSEILTDPSTTQESQNNTQAGSMPLPDFNFTLHGKIQLDLNMDPALLPLLKLIVNKMQETSHSSSEVTVENVIVGPISASSEPLDLIEEPAELSVNIPSGVVEPENVKYGHIVYGDDSWNHVKRFKNLTWKEEGEKLLLKYCSANITTSWKKILELVDLPDDKLRQEIISISTRNNGKTAVRTFITCLREGIIEKPVLPIDPDLEIEKGFSEFQAEEDPDAFARPFVTPYIHTRPDHENGGKVEGTLEG